MGKSGPSSRPGAHVKGWALPSLGMCMWTSWTRQWAHWAYWALFHNLSSSACKNILPSEANLYHRRVTEDPTCEAYVLALETVGHLF